MADKFLIKKIQTFGQNLISDDFAHDVLRLVGDSASPEDVFSLEVLEEWAENNGWAKK